MRIRGYFPGSHLILYFPSIAADCSPICKSPYYKAFPNIFYFIPLQYFFNAIRKKIGYKKINKNWCRALSEYWIKQQQGS
ncbi:MAG: hypothetical protein B6230_04635 [Desulfobacteraceae bacterium 4572_89]|nr:MAG: hypothetical protein B6230_04635 [Desulfobacteraceae bacterium 4572_89]